MNKYILLLAAAATVWPVYKAYGVSACISTGTMCMYAGCTDIGETSDECLFSTEQYYDEYYVNNCTSCASGYKLATRTETHPSNSRCIISYKICERDCTGCTNCTSDTTWSSHGTGYQKLTTRTCDCNTCESETQYRCAIGYYGASANGTSGCNRCPSSGGVYGTTANAGSSSITSCYLPSGNAFSDSAGSGTYTGNCYYTN